MPVKCAKCIEHFREQRRRLELIHDLKAKSESMSHASLKNEVCNWIRQIAEDFEGFSHSVETEVSVKGVGKVDVVGYIGDDTDNINVTIAAECGRTNPAKIEAMKEQFDVVLHIPYCYTWDFIDINRDKVCHQLFTSSVFKGLRKKRPELDIVRNKVYCVAEGECSLPSGRNGFPEEAIQIAMQPIKLKR